MRNNFGGNQRMNPYGGSGGGNSGGGGGGYGKCHCQIRLLDN